MNIFKRILGHLYFFYGMFLFAVTLLLVAIPASIAIMYDEPKRTKIVHKSYWIWMNFLLPIVFCPVRRKGKEKFEKGENYVVIANHNSFADILVSTPWIPGPNKTLAKAELAKIPIFGLVYKSGSILVNRKEENSRRESFTKMQQALKLGLHLCLYPEGTRNKTDEPIQKFYDGAFITAIRAQKPVIPAVIMGTKNILPEYPKYWAQPHSIKIHFLDPIPTKGMNLKMKDELSDLVHAQMKEYFLQHN